MWDEKVWESSKDPHNVCLNIGVVSLLCGEYDSVALGAKFMFYPRFEFATVSIAVIS